MPELTVVLVRFVILTKDLSARFQLLLQATQEAIHFCALPVSASSHDM